jgi:hypothetical protein
MPYDNTSRVSATFNEVGLLTPVASSQPEVLVLGPATVGESFEKFFIGSIGQAEKEFGPSSPLLRVVHEAFAEGSNNLSVMRIGGRPGIVTVTDVADEVLTIMPWNRGDEALARYVPIMIAAEARLLIYDLKDLVYVYDSEEVYVIEEGKVDISVTDGFTYNYDLNHDVNLDAVKAAVDANTAKTLADIVIGDFTAGSGATALATVVAEEGTDGLNDSLVEKYAALADAYHLLHFRDADIVVPVDVYADDANIANDASLATYGYFWPGRHDAGNYLGVPTAGSATDKLGYVAHVIHQGQLLTVFTDTPTYFSVNRVAASKTVLTDLVMTVQADYKGKGGNANTFQYVVGAAGPTVTVTPNTNGGVDILLTDDGSATRAAAATAINTALEDVLLPGGGDYSDVIVATGGVSTLGTSPVAKSNFTSGAGGHVLKMTALTGVPVSTAADAMFADGTDAWLRATSFDHQLATFCYLGSTVWKAMIGTIGTKRPTSVGRRYLSTWVGTLPYYETDGRVTWVGSGNNGDGLLGMKLYAGVSGYRAQIPDTGTSTDGAAYGGLILTNGTGLQTVGGAFGTGFPYGINDGDEAIDENGFPVDIGKHIIVTYDWPVLSTGFGGRSNYRGSFAGGLAGLIARTPTNKLIIGQYGRSRSARGLLKIHPTQLDSLSKIRLTGLKADDTFGTTMISSSTAAHPNSDYTMLSTIRCVSAVMNGIRRISKPYLGRPYNPATIASLQQEVDGYLASIRGGENGLHEGAVASLTYTRRDKILGHLEIRLRMVPPFGIKDVNVSTSLAADESEL